MKKPTSYKRRNFFKTVSGVGVVFGAGVGAAKAAIDANVDVVSGVCSITHQSGTNQCEIHCSPGSHCIWECDDTSGPGYKQGTITVEGTDPAYTKQIYCP